jgi:hypothetical protein
MPSKSKLPQNKRQINPLISVDLYETLLKHVENYGKGRGAISAIVEEALRLYFSQTGMTGGLTGDTRSPSTHTHGTRSVNTPYDTTRESKVMKAFASVLSYIRKLHNYPDTELICEVVETELVNAIRDVIGVDQRTIKKYMKAFQDHKLIKYERGHSPRAFYKVLIYPACNEIAQTP